MDDSLSLGYIFNRKGKSTIFLKDIDEERYKKAVTTETHCLGVIFWEGTLTQSSVWRNNQKERFTMKFL